MVGVTVSNPCGQETEALSVEVGEPGPDQPDLSPSTKLVDEGTVEEGDKVEYTIILRNDHDVAATVTLTDPIPAYTTYVEGSAQASDRSAVSVVDDELRWTGQVIAGTPVFIEFRAEVGVAPVGGTISNVATIDDGLGHRLMLRVDTVYKPDYGLTINEGAKFTNIPTVALRYEWDVDDGITQVRFSNDKGFGAGGNTTAWLAVNAADPTYGGWVLDVEDIHRRYACKVYAQFRDGSGQTYGPFEDRITYDPDKPSKPEIKVLKPSAAGVLAAGSPAADAGVILQVTASDDNSGVYKVQVSHEAGFGTYSDFDFVGPTTDIDWTLQASGEVYVRVVDRAGNVSETTAEQVALDYNVYLPLVLRGAP